jgi:DNA-binding XRE family transcriptional regulator
MSSRRYGLAESERSFIYQMLWFGVPASLLYLGGQFVDLAPFNMIGGAFCAGLLIGLPSVTSNDEYVRAQVDIAASWALAAAGVMLLVALPRFGVSRQAVNAIETGKHDPSLPLAFRIARLLTCRSRRFSMTSDNQSLTGETSLKQRRSLFIGYLVLMLFASIVGGVITGSAGRLMAAYTLPITVFLRLWLTVVIGFVWFTRDYFRRVDELDLLDNLWASTIALYTFFAAAGSWLILYEVGIAPPPEVEVLSIFTFAALLIAYAAHKIGLH